jgi:hypothetical protein
LICRLRLSAAPLNRKRQRHSPRAVHSRPATLPPQPQDPLLDRLATAQGIRPAVRTGARLDRLLFVDGKADGGRPLAAAAGTLYLDRTHKPPATEKTADDIPRPFKGRTLSLSAPDRRNLNGRFLAP